MKKIRDAILNYFFKKELEDFAKAKAESDTLKKANKAVLMYVISLTAHYKKEYSENFAVLKMCQDIGDSLTWVNKDFKGVLDYEQIQYLRKEVDKLTTKSASLLQKERDNRINELELCVIALRKEDKAIRELIQADENESTFDEVERKLSKNK
jgi:hypothetical protein